MTVSTNRVGFHISLPDDYMEQIDLAIKSELEIAQHKWGVILEDEAKEEVVKHSMNQISRRVEDVCKSKWNFNNIVTIRVKGVPKKMKHVNIPKDVDRVRDLNLVVARDGWEVNSETAESAIPASKLQEVVFQKILDWARTAVFYGVGSYRL